MTSCVKPWKGHWSGCASPRRAPVSARGSSLTPAVPSGFDGGRATHEVPDRAEEETGLSQTFIAFDPLWCAGCADAGLADRLVEHLRTASGDERVRYPGERTRALREKHLREGVPVEPSVWQFVQSV